MPPDEQDRNAPPPPTPVTREWVRYLIGFSVGITVGMAPLLGSVNVPGFRPLLGLIPDSMRYSLIPLSSFLMAILSVVVQWFGGERVTHLWLSKWFRTSVLITLGALAAFIVIETFLVVQVPYSGGAQTATFVIGFTRQLPPQCNCQRELSDAQCIADISLQDSEIERCWGDRSVRAARLLHSPISLFWECLELLWGLCSYETE
jgi:hypothetical protein